MRDALNATGRPILFSMCEWGVSSPWEYGHEVSPDWLSVSQKKT
jgi:alpha-galactosidase